MFSPDGSRLLIGSWGTISFDSFPALWDVSKGTQIAKLDGHKSDTQLHGASFSHDGRRIATVSLDGSARIWDGKSGRLLDVLGQESPGLKLNDVASDNRDQEMNAAFSRDDRFLATTSLDGTTRIWDVNHASLLASIVGQGPLVEHLEFSPVDTNILLTASHDGTARLWDVNGILTTVLPHKSPPTFAVFSPDNLHLLTGGGDAAVHLWDIATGREIAELDTRRNYPQRHVQPRWKSAGNGVSRGANSHLGRCEQAGGCAVRIWARPTPSSVQSQRGPADGCFG